MIFSPIQKDQGGKPSIETQNTPIIYAIKKPCITKAIQGFKDLHLPKQMRSIQNYST